MKHTDIYLIRHGQSIANELDHFLGHGDLDLTELGYLQAEKTAAFLKDIPIDVIYSSDLIRAYHTAEATAKIKGLPIITRRELREIDAGKWENMPFHSLPEQYPEDFHVWMTNIGHARCTGGESVLELQSRFLEEVTRIARENQGRAVCIFCHATPIRVLKAALDGCTADEIRTIPWPSNASVTHVRYEDGRLQMLQYSRDDFMGTDVTRLPSDV